MKRGVCGRNTDPVKLRSLTFIATGFYEMVRTVVAPLNEALWITMKMSPAEVLNWLNRFLRDKAKAWEASIREYSEPERCGTFLGIFCCCAHNRL